MAMEDQVLCFFRESPLDVASPTEGVVPSMLDSDRRVVTLKIAVPNNDVKASSWAAALTTKVKAACGAIVGRSDGSHNNGTCQLTLSSGGGSAETPHRSTPYILGATSACDCVDIYCTCRQLKPRAPIYTGT